MSRYLAALLIVVLAPLAQATERTVGRLFYTPAQRLALEDARRRNIRPEGLAGSAKTASKEPTRRPVVVTGLVQRSDGQSFVLVNGKAVDAKTPDGVRVFHNPHADGVIVYDPESKLRRRVKVGQHVDLQTGRVKESYELRRRAPTAETHSDAGPEQAGTTPAKATKREAAPAPTSVSPDRSEEDEDLTGE